MGRGAERAESRPILQLWKTVAPPPASPVAISAPSTPWGPPGGPGPALQSTQGTRRSRLAVSPPLWRLPGRSVSRSAPHSPDPCAGARPRSGRAGRRPGEALQLRVGCLRLRREAQGPPPTALPAARRPPRGTIAPLRCLLLPLTPPHFHLPLTPSTSIFRRTHARLTPPAAPPSQAGRCSGGSRELSKTQAAVGARVASGSAAP